MDNQNTVENAQIAVTDATAAVAAATEASKAAVANHKQARDYAKAVAAQAKTDPENTEFAGKVTEADQSEAGWKIAVDNEKANVTATKEALKAAKAQLVEAEKADKPVKVKVERVEQNGQRKPSAGTSSDTLWNIYSAVAEEKGSAPALEEVLEQARATGIVDGTIKAAYAHWRKFHGITGRVVSEEKLAQAEAEAQAKAQKEADKAAAKEAKAAEAAAKAAAAAPAPTPAV